MNRTNARKIAETITNEQLQQMFETAKNKITDWTKVSNINKGMTKGVAWNILSKDFDMSANYHILAKTNMVREFGEFLPDQAKPKREKRKVNASVHQDPAGVVKRSDCPSGSKPTVQEEEDPYIKFIVSSHESVPLQSLQKYSKIEKELERAEKKHPEFPADMFRQLAIMQEEAGEVTKAVLDYHYEKGTLEHVKEELIQTAAMCMRMLEHLPSNECRCKELNAVNRICQDCGGIVPVRHQQTENPSSLADKEEPCCPDCGNEDLEYLDQYANGEYWKCKECGNQFIFSH